MGDDGPNAETTALYLKKATKARLKRVAEREKRSMSQIAEFALEIGLNDLDPQPKKEPS